MNQEINIHLARSDCRSQRRQLAFGLRRQASAECFGLDNVIGAVRMIQKYCKKFQTEASEYGDN